VSANDIEWLRARLDGLEAALPLVAAFTRVLVSGRNSDQHEAMAKIDVAEDLVPIGEFKTHASQLLRKLHETGRPLVITQNGKASAVVLTPEEFEQLGYRQYVQQKIKAGERSSEAKTYSLQQVAKHLKKRIRAKVSEG
jgi:prevent-host-death family protein